MQENYFVMANLPICSFFDIDGERHCDVCKNSSVCYGDNINIIFDNKAAAEKWQRSYKDRSIFCRLLSFAEAKQSAQLFLGYDSVQDSVIEYRYDRSLGRFTAAGSTAAAEYRVPSKTARFAANVLKLLKQGK